MFNNLSKIFPRALRASAIVAAALIFSGCSAGLQTYASYDRQVSFGQYKTFAFASDQAPKPEGAYQSLGERYLQQAVRKELSARGMSEAKEPQLLIAFNSASKEKIAQLPSMSTDVRHYVDAYGRVRTVAISGEPQIVQYTEGTMSVDVIDAKEKHVLWQGVAVGRKTIPKDNSLEDDINLMITKIFEKYPLGKLQPMNTQSTATQP